MQQNASLQSGRPSYLICIRTDTKNRYPEFTVGNLSFSIIEVDINYRNRLLRHGLLA